MNNTSPGTSSGGPHTGPALSFKSVAKRFGKVTALDGVSFTVQPGETVALWGTNGAGKSTALRCLLGLTPFTGEISVTGYDVRRQGKRARSLLGYVPQEVAFHGDMSVSETVSFYGRLKGVGDRVTDQAIENVDLVTHRDAQIDELSGGLRQRLAVAVAMLNDPPVLLLDEPTSNLDRDSRSKLMKILRTLRDQGTTIVFTSHRHDEVIDLAQRVIVLERGQVVADGTPHDLAGRLGWSAVLRVLVGSDDVTAALTTLTQEGLQAARNGRGIIVTGPAHQRATALHSLVGAGIKVEGFETEDSPHE
jgi:ABC-type multidrug transport system ATPase subunit